MLFRSNRYLCRNCQSWNSNRNRHSWTYRNGTCLLLLGSPYLCDSLWIRLPFPCIYHRENRWNHRRCYGSRKRACGSIITACCYCSYKVYRNDTIIIISILVFKNEIMMREVVEKTIDIYLYMKVDKRSARMRSDSDRNMSASLTRITRQVSRTFDLKYKSIYWEGVKL